MRRTRGGPGGQPGRGLALAGQRREAAQGGAPGSV